MINYSEFLVAAMDRRLLLTNRRIEACFRWFDINQDGEISVSEFKECLGTVFVRENDWERVMIGVDINKNGKIDYSEFTLFF